MLLLATLVHFALPLPILAAPVQGPIILAQLGTYKDSNCKSSPKVIYLIEDQCFQSPGQGTSMEVIGLRNGNDEGQKCQVVAYNGANCTELNAEIGPEQCANDESDVQSVKVVCE